MKLYLLASLLLLTSLGCSRPTQPQWQPVLDGGHHISRNDAAIFAFTFNGDPEHSVAFFFPFGIGSSSSHNSNAGSRTFSYSGTIQNEDSKSDVLTYKVSSERPTVMTCNGTQFDFGDGTVFHVDANGTVLQLPFVGLKPTENYVETLRQYFAANADTPGLPTALP